MAGRGKHVLIPSREQPPARRGSSETGGRAADPAGTEEALALGETRPLPGPPSAVPTGPLRPQQLVDKQSPAGMCVLGPGVPEPS